MQTVTALFPAWGPSEVPPYEEVFVIWTPSTFLSLGQSRLMLVFLIKQCPFQSSKGPVSVTSYATTPVTGGLGRQAF